MPNAISKSASRLMRGPSARPQVGPAASYEGAGEQRRAVPSRSPEGEEAAEEEWGRGFDPAGPPPPLSHPMSNHTRSSVQRDEEVAWPNNSPRTSAIISPRTLVGSPVWCAPLQRMCAFFSEPVPQGGSPDGGPLKGWVPLWCDSHSLPVRTYGIFGGVSTWWESASTLTPLGLTVPRGTLVTG